MKNIKCIFALIIIFIFSFLINVPGINWGLPGVKTLEMVIGDYNLYKILVPVMVAEREEIRSMVKIPGQPYHKFYDENKTINIKYNGYDLNLTLGQLNAIRTYFLRTYYPDEHITIVALTNIDVENKQFNPKVLIPGCFYLYSSGLWLLVGSRLGIVKLSDGLDYFLKNINEMRRIYLWMRTLVLLSFFVSIWLLWIVGKRLWNEKIGLVACLLFGISPVMNLWNHFGYYYTFSLPFVIMAFYFSAKALNDYSDSARNYVLAGIFSGISASIVLLYGVSIIFSVCSFFIKYKIFKKELKKFFYGLLSMLLTFLVINIFLFADISTLLHLVKFEQGDFVFSFNPILFIFGSLKSACGWPFLISALCGLIAVIIYKKDKKEIFFVISIMVLLIIFSCFSPWYARRGIFLMPFMALSSGMLLNYLKRGKMIACLIFLFLSISTFIYSASYTKIFVCENIRDEAGKWINLNIPGNSKIGLIQFPAPYRTPPFQFHRYKIMPVSWNNKLLEVLQPDYFIISDYETLGLNETQVNDFFKGYNKIIEFKKNPFLAGFSFKRTSFSARDFWIPNPCITIYKKKKVGKNVEI